jgi:hypothetical protein
MRVYDVQGTEWRLQCKQKQHSPRHLAIKLSTQLWRTSQINASHPHRIETCPSSRVLLTSGPASLHRSPQFRQEYSLPPMQCIFEPNPPTTSTRQNLTIPTVTPTHIPLLHKLNPPAYLLSLSLSLSHMSRFHQDSSCFFFSVISLLYLVFVGRILS